MLETITKKRLEVMEGGRNKKGNQERGTTILAKVIGHTDKGRQEANRKWVRADTDG